MGTSTDVAPSVCHSVAVSERLSIGAILAWMLGGPSKSPSPRSLIRFPQQRPASRHFRNAHAIIGAR
eukprot:4183230-Pyramimonas_sp.AAC.1